MKMLPRNLVFVLGLLSTSPVLSAEQIQIKEPWVRENLPGMTMTAGYFQLTNLSETEKAIISAGSDCAAKVEVHEHKFVDGLMKMQRVDSLVVKKQSSVTFSPGGYHLMLLDVSTEVKSGYSCRIRLSFSDKTSIDFVAPVKAIVR